ncbi:uncharacterized ferritin-like protein (DUF455 family) [Hydrogenophaga palleronii]|uniref:Uncharacterized ferritin-like protein (DUF455 family) n=1 Tax=Hydrogenophaga palleronii TaxID=65655 RepID=A0ABU1WIK7_9BURK|nr:DUF455 family protein [Hydrogenophaga palleronii]MDR7149112.1 uncharacterized ferritin-like protein (DUF455 family) [Hydrogenophaga palleronii]
MQAISTPAPVSLRTEALRALCMKDPGAKVLATHVLFEAMQMGNTTLDPSARLEPEAGALLPGRPTKPHLIAPTAGPQRSPFTPEGLAALLHAVTHIEFNAINLVVKT